MDKRYTDMKEVGKGSYGVVCSALDSTSGSKVAIKKITPMAEHSMDAVHVLREIRLMRHMGRHENIISLVDLSVRESADELYIIMELMDSDLHRIIQSPQRLSNEHFRHFMHQLLAGVKFLHDNRIIHRDLKPGNLLVSRNCKLQITDFGLAREKPSGTGEDPEEDINVPMTEHVVTRWYRPPELMLCPDGLYTYAVDMWSVGCIFAEMLGRKPLFPGKNFVHQLGLIFAVIGAPERKHVAHIINRQAIKFIKSQEGLRRKDLAEIYPGATDEAITLLDNILLFQPDERFSVGEALADPYFAKCKPIESPGVCAGLNFDFEKKKMPKTALKKLILAEQREFREEKQLQIQTQTQTAHDAHPLDSTPVRISPERQALAADQAGLVAKRDSPKSPSTDCTPPKQQSPSGPPQAPRMSPVVRRTASSSTATVHRSRSAQKENHAHAAQTTASRLAAGRPGTSGSNLREVAAAAKEGVLGEKTRNPGLAPGRQALAPGRQASTGLVRKVTTVPQSPKFSQMSWQKHASAANSGAGEIVSGRSRPPPRREFVPAAGKPGSQLTSALTRTKAFIRTTSAPAKRNDLLVNRDRAMTLHRPRPSGF